MMTDVVFLIFLYFGCWAAGYLSGQSSGNKERKFREEQAEQKLQEEHAEKT